MAETAEEGGAFNLSGCYEVSGSKSPKTPSKSRRDELRRAISIVFFLISSIPSPVGFVYSLRSCSAFIRLQLATELLDIPAINAYYTFTGCPWYFRKILVAAQRRLEDIVIQHDNGVGLVFKYTLKFFGRKNKSYILDGSERETENMWGRKIRTCCTQAEETVRIQVDGPPYAPDGFNLNTFELEDVGGEMLVCWRRSIWGGDEKPIKDGEGREVGTTIYFRPVEEEGRK